MEEDDTIEDLEKKLSSLKHKVERKSKSDGVDIPKAINMKNLTFQNPEGKASTLNESSSFGFGF